MNPIKAIASEDTELQEEIKKTGKSFDFFWELMKPKEVGGLKVLTGDPITVAAYFKKTIHAMVRAHQASTKQSTTADIVKRILDDARAEKTIQEIDNRIEWTAVPYPMPGSMATEASCSKMIQDIRDILKKYKGANTNEKTDSEKKETEKDWAE